MNGERMKKIYSSPLSPELQAEIDALIALPETEINTADLPEVRDWSDAKRGVFYRPVKQQITLRSNADIVK
jgi:uncharacterized protein (DUF4415 family)